MVVPYRRAGSHALLTRSPLPTIPKDGFSFDLHVLGLPPAFVLSQDQTLKLNVLLFSASEEADPKRINVIPRKRTLAAPSSEAYAPNQGTSNRLRRQRQINAAHASLPIHDTKSITRHGPIRSATRGGVLRPAPAKVKVFSPNSAKMKLFYTPSPHFAEFGTTDSAGPLSTHRVPSRRG